MELWSVVIPLLKVMLYLASFGTIGTILFFFHFKLHLPTESLSYCYNLTKRCAIWGLIIAAASFFSVAGNMGGNLISVLDMLMLQLALESSAGIAAVTSFLGFSLLLFWSRALPFWRKGLVILGVFAISWSFLMTGHSTKEGLFTQVLLLVHLTGISFWLGSLLPLRQLCHSTERKNLHTIAKLFGLFALGYVGALVLAGLIFAYKLMGGLSPLLSTAYGNALLAKIILVSLLLLLGAINKFRLVPLLLKDEIVGVKKFKKSLQFEIVLVFLILFITSLLTTSLTMPALL